MEINAVAVGGDIFSAWRWLTKSTRFVGDARIIHDTARDALGIFLKDDAALHHSISLHPALVALVSRTLQADAR